MAESPTENARTDVTRWVMRLIDFGKGRADSELEDMTLGEVADRIIACVNPPH